MITPAVLLARLLRDSDLRARLRPLVRVLFPVTVRRGPPSTRRVLSSSSDPITGLVPLLLTDAEQPLLPSC